MIRTALLAVALSVTPALAGAPALVTLAQGAVTLPDGTTPSAPFVLAEGQALTLADGATVVVLHEGTATRLRGPAEISTADLNAPAAGGGKARGALDAVLTRHVSFAKAGASRGDAIHLVRPVPGGTVVAPHRIAWRCDACGNQPVEVFDFMGDKTVWTGTGDGSVAYGGPTLGPGAYLVKVGTHEFSFTVAPTEEQERVKLARDAADAAVKGLEGQGVRDATALVSIPAGVYLQAGLASEALWLVDEALDAHPGDAALVDLKTTYERHAGVTSGAP